MTTVEHDPKVQELLDKEANLANRRHLVHKQIKVMRGTEPPRCWGMDDCSTQILSTCPWALLWIVISVFILLLIFTNSMILPIKAVLLNGLSLSATLGVLSYIFIGGHLKNIVGGLS